MGKLRLSLENWPLQQESLTRLERKITEGEIVEHTCTKLIKSHLHVI